MKVIFKYLIQKKMSTNWKNPASTTEKDKVVPTSNELLNAIDSHLFDNVDENKNLYGNYEINYRQK